MTTVLIQFLLFGKIWILSFCLQVYKYSSMESKAIFAKISRLEEVFSIVCFECPIVLLGCLSATYFAINFTDHIKVKQFLHAKFSSCKFLQNFQFRRGVLIWLGHFNIQSEQQQRMFVVGLIRPTTILINFATKFFLQIHHLFILTSAINTTTHLGYLSSMDQTFLRDFSCFLSEFYAFQFSTLLRPFDIFMNDSLDLKLRFMRD